MIEIYLNSKLLYFPNDEEFVIFDAKLKQSVGECGSFSFKVPALNPLQSELGRGSIITIMRDDVEFWRGEVRELSTDFNKTIEVYCVEDLAWLADEFMAPAQITDETKAQRFQSAIGTYNTNRSGERVFTVGTCEGSNTICNWSTQYDWSILDSIRNCICGEDGLLRVRRVTNAGTVTRYIDVVKLADYGTLAQQEIQFGENLLDFVREMDMSIFTNALTPYGAELDSEVYEGCNERLAGTPIEDLASIGAYGRHAKVVVFDVEDVDTLNSLAQAYLTRYSQPQITMDIKAVDLAELYSVEPFSLGDSVHVVAEPYAVDQWMYVTELEIDIQDISKNVITMSSYVTRGKTFTEQVIDTSDIVKDLPSKSSILEAAKKNAFAILEGADGGYVHFIKNNNDVITDIVIMNNATDATSTRKWVFNSGGLGHFTRETPNDTWSAVNVAMTMDGQIVAEAITSGVMTGQTIQGATIQTLANGRIESERSDHSKVEISGGQLTVTNTDDSFLELKKYGSSARITLGADTWSFRNSNGSTYQEFDVWEDIYKLIKHWEDFGPWPHS